jgi:hypothetical protein
MEKGKEEELRKEGKFSFVYSNEGAHKRGIGGDWTQC